MLINKITTTFGDHSSLLPLFTKDIINSTGMTAFSYEAGGKIEGKDRFIDEFGTQAIWLGGLPSIKWLFNKTAYKFANINPNVDVRLLKDKIQLGVAQNYAQSLSDKKIAESLSYAAQNTKKTGNLFLAKFATATALTLASFFTLVKVKQEYTEKQIKKQFWAKKSEQEFYNDKVAKSPAFKAFNTNEQVKPMSGKKVAFKGLASRLSKFMFDPVQNLLLIDVGITGERLANSRNKGEFVEYAIKEGGFLFFMYVAGQRIQKFIENVGSKLGKPIGLHADAYTSEYLAKDLASGKAANDVKIVQNLINSNDKKSLFEFIYDSKNAENTVIKAAKQSGAIHTFKTGNKLKKMLGVAKDTGIIDPHKFISINKFENVLSNVSEIVKHSGTSQNNIEKFLKSCRNVKIASVLANMGISCFFLGFVLPYSMMKYRATQQNGNTDFHVKNEIEKQLEMNFKGRVA